MDPGGPRRYSRGTGCRAGGQGTVLRERARTAETYLAGLGTSGALMTGALVVFLIVVGIVTFDSWPRAAGGLFGGGADVVSEGTSSDAAAVETSDKGGSLKA